jgi:hypothetical protein
MSNRRFEVTIIGKDREEHFEYDSLDEAYSHYLQVKALPVEVDVHDLEEQVTIISNTNGE